MGTGRDALVWGPRSDQARPQDGERRGGRDWASQADGDVRYSASNPFPAELVEAPLHGHAALKHWGTARIRLLGSFIGPFHRTRGEDIGGLDPRTDRIYTPPPFRGSKLLDPSVNYGADTMRSVPVGHEHIRFDAGRAIRPPQDVLYPAPRARPLANGVVSKVMTVGSRERSPTGIDLVHFHMTVWDRRSGRVLYSSAREMGNGMIRPLDALRPEVQGVIEVMSPGERRRAWIGDACFDFHMLDCARCWSVQTPSDVAEAPQGALQLLVEGASQPVRAVVMREGPDPGEDIEGEGEGEAGERDTSPPGKHDMVLVHYAIWTADGEMQECTGWHGMPAELPMDCVIPGLAALLGDMSVGDVRRAWVPAELAYGGASAQLERQRIGGTKGLEALAAGDVPTGDLTFEIELLDIERHGEYSQTLQLPENAINFDELPSAIELDF